MFLNFMPPMRFRAVYLAITCALLSAPSAFAQSVPPWKSYTQTGNLRDVVPSAGGDNSVAAWLGRKMDAANGHLQNPDIQGGAVNGTNITGAVSLADGGTMQPRTLSAHFGDTISVLDYGARCDGSSFDDAPAFTAAITSGLERGRKVIFGGRCHFATPVTVSGHGWIGMDLDGRGSTITTDAGVSGISIEADASTPQADRVPVTIHDFIIRTAAGSSGTVGVSLKADNGWNLDNNSEYNLTINNFSKQISLINIGENRLYNSALFGDSNSIGYYASGMSGASNQWANNNVISHVEAVGGTCVNYNGALQGDKIFGLGCMNAVQGVIVTNGDMAQSFEVHQSYFDVTRTGVNFDSYGLSIIDTSSADIAGGIPDPTYGYTAFSMKNCGGCKLTDNFLFGLGSSTNTPMVAGGSQILVSGNYVHGLDGHLAHCIELQTPVSLGTPDHIVFSNNTCWAAGDFYINGDETRVFGTGNVSSGSGTAASVANGALPPTQHDYGPVVLRANDLPNSGSFFRVGNLPDATQAFIIANLDAAYPNALVDLELGGVSKFHVDPHGSAIFGGSVEATGFLTAGGSMLLLDSVSHGVSMGYSDALIGGKGGVHLNPVNGRPANFVVEGLVATSNGICLDTACTTTVQLSGGKTTISYSGVPVFSVDSSGNVIAKGSITQNGAP